MRLERDIPGLRNRPVHIPFNEGNIIGIQQPGHEIKHERLHLRLAQIQQQLIAEQGTFPCRKLVDPVRMLAV
ncbi:hypothetical protein D3C87_1893480 [compost metagenome]